MTDNNSEVLLILLLIEDSIFSRQKKSGSPLFTVNKQINKCPYILNKLKL